MPTASYNASQFPFAHFLLKSLQKFSLFELTREKTPNMIVTGALRMRVKPCFLLVPALSLLSMLTESPLSSFPTSLKEFLMSSRLANAAEHLSLYHIIPSSSHAFLARSYLGVLLTLGDDIDKSVVEKRPFAIYAAQYWVDHTKFESVSLGIQEFMKRLFDSDAPYFATWVWIYDIDRPWKGFMPMVQPTEPEAKPLYYAALCGFRSLVEHLIVIHQIDVNSRDGDHGMVVMPRLGSKWLSQPS